MTLLTTLDQLEALYGSPAKASVIKETTFLTPTYRAFIERSPFLALSTFGHEGGDCSPRGEAGGLVRVEDEKTILLPDRRGNNRCDSLRNIIETGRVGLLFMVPGSHSVVRVNGTAVISVEPALLARFEQAGKRPRSVLVITVEAAYFQCARALLRARIWDPQTFVGKDDLPSPGAFLADASCGEIDGKDYDARWQQKAQETLW